MNFRTLCGWWLLFTITGFLIGWLFASENFKNDWFIQHITEHYADLVLASASIIAVYFGWQEIRNFEDRKLAESLTVFNVETRKNSDKNITLIFKIRNQSNFYYVIEDLVVSNNLEGYVSILYEEDKENGYKNDKRYFARGLLKAPLVTTMAPQRQQFYELSITLGIPDKLSKADLKKEIEKSGIVVRPVYLNSSNARLIPFYLPLDWDKKLENI